MNKFLSPYKIKWYKISVNDGHIHYYEKLFGKYYAIDYLKRLFKFSIGKNKYYVYLSGLHHKDDYRQEVIDYLKETFEIRPLNLDWGPQDNPTALYCYYWYRGFGGQNILLYVGTLSQGLKLVRKGLTSFQPSNINRLIPDYPLNHNASVAYNYKNNSWAGWSRHSYAEFKIGYMISENDILLSNPFVEGCDLYDKWNNMLKEKGICEGFVAQTLGDCKLLARIFAETSA